MIRLAFITALVLLLPPGSPGPAAGAGEAPPATRPDARPARSAADRLLAQATEELGRMPKPSSGNTQTWGRWWAASDVAVAQLRLGNLDAAKAAANSIGNDGLKNGAYRQLAGLLARQGKYDQAKAIRHWSPFIPDNPDLALWSQIARAQARRGEMAGAKTTAGEIQSDRYKDVVWQMISAGSCEAGRLADASEALAQIHDPGHRVVALSGLAVARFEAKDVAGAKESCEAAKREMQASPAKDREAMVAAIARALARTATVAEARAFVDASLGRYNRLDAYAETVEGLAERGDVANALPLADELRSQMIGMDDMKRVADAYRSVASAQAKRGQFDAARATAAKASLPAGERGPAVELLRPMAEAGRAEILTDLAEAELEAGRASQAMKDGAAALDVLKNGKVGTSGAYGRVAALYIRAGQIDEAFDLLKNCSPDAEQRCHAYARAAGDLAPFVNPADSEPPSR